MFVLSTLVLDADKAYDPCHMHPRDTSSFYKSLGDLIRRRRKQLKLTQEALAARLRVSRASIANIETGRQKVLVHQLFELAAALKMAVEAFLVTPIDEPVSQNFGDLPLPNNLSQKQKGQISRLLGDSKIPLTRNVKEE